MKPIVLIPARMGSTRLPGKPLAEIAGEPMIAHVWRRACAANAGPVVAWESGGKRGRALYFTRATAPAGEGPLYYHVGVYAFTRRALARFVGLAPSQLEQREKLEQLRALEAGMSIAVARVDRVPLS